MEQKTNRKNKNIFKKADLSFLSSDYKINSCIFKKQYLTNADTRITLKPHYHSVYEIHFIYEGQMVYNIGGETAELGAGDYMIVLPRVEHRVLSFAENTVKYHLTLSLEGDAYKAESAKGFIRGKFGGASDIFLHIELLLSKSCENSRTALGASVFNIICSLPLFCENTVRSVSENDNQDIRLTAAKQYIADNICRNPTCEQVAQRCYLSVKQLSRIFIKSEGVSLKKYITGQKIAAAEKMLSEDSTSLHEISERLGFCSEYYFNTFFKKNAGLPPGEYRHTFRYTDKRRTP